jgi:glycosyltransferase involved in cell wall biosynthesis
VRICIIGKFPPIQGGVSMRTYWSAHGLAARGHEVHVVTNAKEAAPPYRMHMREQDWRRCEAAYADGSVRVHWTDPADRAQSYIPFASPFVTKLASMVARLHAERRFDVIFSHYLEPYGVAGYLASQMTGAPHVVRMAGSDAGRLWRHPQFEPLYDHVLRTAEVVIATGVVAERAVERRVDADRIAAGGAFVVPERLFAPNGPILDLPALRAEVEADPQLRGLLWGGFAGDRPYFGVCGKLGERKGSYALLAALHRLKRAGVDVGLVALAHGPEAVERSFRARARKLGLADRILQIPFLPHWRVPEFLRGCLAVCCLEQHFPIGFHQPIIPREVLLCGACLVGSTEVIRKLPSYERLPDGYGCAAIEDINDIDALGDRLCAIGRDPALAAAIGARGRDFAIEVQRDIGFPQRLERILEAAAARERVASPGDEAADDIGAKTADGRFPLTRLVATSLGATDENRHANDRSDTNGARLAPAEGDLPWARELLATIEKGIAGGKSNWRALATPVQVEIAIAAMEDEVDAQRCPPLPASCQITDGLDGLDGLDAQVRGRDKARAAPCHDPMFRLRLRRWGLKDGDVAALVPVRDPRLRILAFDHDILPYLGARAAAEFPSVPSPGRGYIIAFGRLNGERRPPLVVDHTTARILELTDGTRSAAEIASHLQCDAGNPTEPDIVTWIEKLFVAGLVLLQDAAFSPEMQALPNLPDRHCNDL